MKKYLIAVVVGFLAGLACTGSMPAGEAVESAQLTNDDYVEIERLYAKYAHSIDGLHMVGEEEDYMEGRGDAYADLFAEDGQIFVEGIHKAPIRGRDALVEFAERHLENGPAVRRHVITNFVVTPNDDGTAKGESYLMLVDMSTNPPVLMSNRATADTFVKTPNGWRFQWRNNSLISNNTAFIPNAEQLESGTYQ